YLVSPKHDMQPRIHLLEANFTANVAFQDQTVLGRREVYNIVTRSGIPLRKEKYIRPTSAFQPISTEAANQDIATGISHYLVLSSAPHYHVVPCISSQEIIPGAADNYIVSIPSHNH